MKELDDWAKEKMKDIYLDSASMAKTLPCAREAFLNAPFGNPSAEHEVGQTARDALEQAREKIAALMDCEPQEIYFVSTATEASALAMHSLACAGYRVSCSPYEHHAVLENFYETGIEWNSANVYLALHLAWAWMLANNELGTIYESPNSQWDSNTPPLLWLCDATAAVGHIPVSFKTLGCDYLIADGIKFGGVPGAAFLIAKRGAPLSTLIRGGGQERGMRSGTENVPAICAMAAALEWQTEHMQENTQKIAAMRQMLIQSLSRIPDHKWNTPFDTPCLPHILNISFDGVEARSLALLLSRDEVMVSPGAACSNGLREPSHVIMAMYHDEARARSAIRISLSHENTPEECVHAAYSIKSAVEYLRRLN